MSNPRRKQALNTVSVSLGCGISCTKPKLISHIFNPKPKPKNPTYQKNNLCHKTSSYVESSSHFCDYNNMKKKKKASKGVVAVEKDSEDPFVDFKNSMLQMILENEIYTKEGLRELLNCFLQLNSPNHHGVIVRAFTEIWNGVFSSVRSNSSPRFHHFNGSRKSTRGF